MQPALAFLLLAAPALAQDFNGDGYGDLAVGAPKEDVGAYSDAGAVTVFYGGANGLKNTGVQQWTQDSTGIANFCENGDQFGVALAHGDFDGNGYDDLAIGANLEDLAATNCGAVHVLYGGPNGLASLNNEFWHQDSSGVLDSCESWDQFGAELSAGDFNGDGYADLAIGVIYEDLGRTPVTDCGAVAVLYGSPGGLSSTNNQLWSQDSGTVPDLNEASDYFGWTLASGDFNADGRDDLAVGTPYEKLYTSDDAGAVIVLNGSASGLTSMNSKSWNQASLSGEIESNDCFGWALATGDFDGNGADDLAVGSPTESLEAFGTIAEVGTVQVLYGAPGTGLSNANGQSWTQSATFQDGSEAHDWFGYALAAADFNNDGRADLAIGVPFEDLDFSSQGAVNVLNGGPVGLSTSGAKLLHQGNLGFADPAEGGDNFGFALRAGRFLGGSYASLAVGVPHEDAGTVVDCGAVQAIYGSGSGLGAAGTQFYHQGSSGVPDNNETFDGFGSSL
ncbi:MAG: hypothetical protein EYC70_07760 [Planctomycetota bacterium]|nr:MAG: hypothetical protein EYC70_07760 [Planctomycetota bacterium]